MLHFYQLQAETEITDKPWIILMHGLFGESGNLQAIAQSMNKTLNINVIVPDMLNHGRSPHSGKMSYLDMALSVELLIDHLNLVRPILIGHSMGGKIAIQMVANASYEYTACVIVDIAPVDYLPAHLPIIKSMQFIALAFGEQRIYQRREADALLKDAVEQSSLRQFLLKNLKRNAEKQWQWQFGLNEISANYSLIVKPPIFSDKSRVFSNPCLVIKGADSDYIDVASQPQFDRRFSDIQFKIINGAGHWLHSEKPELFCRLIHAFILRVLTEKH